MSPTADMGSWALVSVGESCEWAGTGKAGGAHGTLTDLFNLCDKEESIKSAESEVNRKVSL